METAVRNNLHTHIQHRYGETNTKQAAKQTKPIRLHEYVKANSNDSVHEGNHTHTRTHMATGMHKYFNTTNFRVCINTSAARLQAFDKNIQHKILHK